LNRMYYRNTNAVIVVADVTLNPVK